MPLQAYTVQAGDTVLGIAEKFGLKPETIQWSNPGLELNADLIRPGDTLQILPIDGAIHTVTSGDTLGGIASKYKVTVEDIAGYGGNGLADTSAALTIGMKLVIPNGTKTQVNQQAVAYSSGAAPANAKIGGGNFSWPASGSINQRYWSGHAAIDVGAWTGAPVTAADGGYVAVAAGGWNAGYGNHVIIDHGNGFVTLYAHLNSIFVKPGESVASGQQIGSVGNTGNSTGPHLHFELRYQGVPRNPLNYLP
jgi:murein DD-endopeptidase MepM/ murein hydrolase activator NlpD